MELLTAIQHFDAEPMKKLRGWSTSLPALHLRCAERSAISTCDSDMCRRCEHFMIGKLGTLWAAAKKDLQPRRSVKTADPANRPSSPDNAGV